MATYDLRSSREIMDEAVARLRGDLVDCDSSLQVAAALTSFQRRYNAVKDRLERTPASVALAKVQAIYMALTPILAATPTGEAQAGDEAR